MDFKNGPLPYASILPPGMLDFLRQGILTFFMEETWKVLSF
tara:strand:- start:176 stop:298 length:123 start_codon:yes stop_codon:yes gene_type:complete